jgi:hypothetical protein
MDDAEAQRTFDEVQREKAELGIPSEPEAQSPDTAEPEVEVTKEEPVVEPKPVSEKEEIVPPKEYKEIKENLRAELQKDFDEKLAKFKEEAGKVTPNETKSDDLEEDVKNLAKELDFDPEKVRKIIEVSRKGLQLSPEDKQALEEFKSTKAEREAKEQETVFNEEWTTLPIKDQFPNASEEQLKAAKDKMDELSHSEKYHEMDMDYILFKEKATFDQLLFSPKMKTFESGKLAPQETEVDEWPEIKPNMSPAQIEKLIEKRERITENMGREKMLMRTTDDSGRSVEKWV